MSEVNRYVAIGGMMPVDEGYGEGVYVRDGDFRVLKSELEAQRKDFDRVTAERDAALAQESTLARDAANWKRKACESADREYELQQRLTAADERADVLTGQLAARESEIEEFSIEMTLAITDSQIRSAMTVIGRSRFLQLLQAYNARIDAALKPAKMLTADHKCIECESEYCHGVCVERGDSDDRLIG